MTNLARKRFFEDPEQISNVEGFDTWLQRIGVDESMISHISGLLMFTPKKDKGYYESIIEKQVGRVQDIFQSSNVTPASVSESTLVLPEDSENIQYERALTAFVNLGGLLVIADSTREETVIKACDSNSKEKEVEIPVKVSVGKELLTKRAKSDKTSGFVEYHSPILVIFEGRRAVIKETGEVVSLPADRLVAEEEYERVAIEIRNETDPKRVSELYEIFHKLGDRLRVLKENG